MKKCLWMCTSASILIMLLFQVKNYMHIGIFNYAFTIQLFHFIIMGTVVWLVVAAFKKTFMPLVVFTLTASIILISSHVFEVELNYYLFDEDRQAIIEMLVAGELKKTSQGQTGFAFYKTPSEYQLANRETFLDARMHGEDIHFVFFQSARPRTLDFIGLSEGFLYTSTGKFPTLKEFDWFQYNGHRKINDQWYFVSSDEERFLQSCRFLCGEPMKLE